MQGWLDLKASKEESQGGIHYALGEKLNHVRSGTSRALNSIFGNVIVTRKSYRQSNEASLFLMDAELNLSNDKYSDGIRYRVSKEALRGSFDNAIETIGETTGGYVPKRQSLNLARMLLRILKIFTEKNVSLNQKRHPIFWF